MFDMGQKKKTPGKIKLKYIVNSLNKNVSSNIIVNSLNTNFSSNIVNSVNKYFNNDTINRTHKGRIDGEAHGREEQRTHLGAGGEGGDEDPPMPQGALGEGVASRLCAVPSARVQAHARFSFGLWLDLVQVFKGFMISCVHLAFFLSFSLSLSLCGFLPQQKTTYAPADRGLPLDFAVINIPEPRPQAQRALEGVASRGVDRRSARSCCQGDLAA